MSIFLSSPPGDGDDFIQYMLLEDSEGKLDEYIEQLHSRELKTAYFGRNAASVVNRGNYTFIPNYTQTPQAKINQLVIPTGATRWSYCLLLATDEMKDRIYDYVETGPLSGMLNLTISSDMADRDEKGQAVSITGSVLPPLPITPPWPVKILQRTDDTYQYVDDPNHAGLWVIPFVDERYWWQMMHTGDLAAEVETALELLEPSTPITESDEAREILLTLTAKTGSLWINTGVNPLHTATPTCAVQNDYENLPIVIDSVATHYGMLVVPDMSAFDSVDGNYGEIIEVRPRGRTRYALIDGENSTYVYNSALQGKLGLQSVKWAPDGSKFDAAASPAERKANAETQLVGVPLHVSGGQITGGNVLGNAAPNDRLKKYPVAPDSVQVGSGEGTFTTKLYTVMDAEWSVKRHDDIQAIWRLRWESQLSSNAITRAAKDYYFQYVTQFDYTFAGTQPWQPTFFDDYMVVRQCYSRYTKAYDATTRVVSRQPNLIGEFTGASIDGRIEAALAADLAAPTSSLAAETSGEAYPLSRKTDGTSELVGPPIIFKNSDPELAGEKGTYCRLEKMSGVYKIYYIGCNPQQELIDAVDDLEA